MPPTSSSDPQNRAVRSQRTHDLLRAAHLLEPGDPRRAALLDEVVLVNRGVAEAVAARYRGRGIDEADLRQAAFEGLVKAVQNFDPSVRPDLLTYAVPTIRGQVLRYFRDHGWMIRPPRPVQELQGKISRSIDSLSGRLGRTPTDAEISADISSPIERVREATAAFGSFRPISLDAPRGEHEVGIAETLANIDDHELGAAEARAMIGPALAVLTPRERRVLDLVYVDGRSQSEVGEMLGISQVQVSRLLAKILQRLRTELGVTTASPART